VTHFEPERWLMAAPASQLLWPLILMRREPTPKR